MHEFCGLGDCYTLDRVARQSIVPRSQQPVMAEPNAAKIYDGPYAAQLIETANAMVAPGKGPRPCRSGIAEVSSTDPQKLCPLR